VAAPELTEDTPLASCSLDGPANAENEPNNNVATAVTAAAVLVTAVTIRRRRSVVARRYT
jgi:hypothetical protein